MNITLYYQAKDSKDRLLHFLYYERPGKRPMVFYQEKLDLKNLTGVLDWTQIKKRKISTSCFMDKVRILIPI